MESYDLELGPIQRTFDDLFRYIALYFQSAPVVPIGSVTETDLSTQSQQELHETVNSSLKRYGFTFLPNSLKITAEEDSVISGIHRSDNITVYDEKMKDGSRRTFNFYNTYGPEHMKTSYYWLDKRNGGEQTNGILTMEDKWYMRIDTSRDMIYYLRVDKESPR